MRSIDEFHYKSPASGLVFSKYTKHLVQLVWFKLQKCAICNFSIRYLMLCHLSVILTWLSHFLAVPFALEETRQLAFKFEKCPKSTLSRQFYQSSFDIRYCAN